MKLELKHLAAYLPYELKGKRKDGGKEIYTLSSIYYNNTEVWRPDEFGDNTMMPMYLMLRPLSDLTKEIEHNGERFIPIVELTKASCPFDTSDCKFEIFNDEAAFSIACNLERKGSVIWFLDFSTHFMYFEGDNEVNDHMPINQLALFQKLHEWHFDLYGLIENGLALPLLTPPINNK